MMGMVNIGTILEHGRALSVVRRAVTAVQASPATSKVDEVASMMTDEYPILFKLVVQLTFAMLSRVEASYAKTFTFRMFDFESISDLFPNISCHTLKTHRS